VTDDEYWRSSAIDDCARLFRDDFLPVIRFVMCMGASMAEAEDAAQEAFYEAVRLAGSKPDEWLGMGRKAKRAWIRTIASRRYLRPPGPRVRPLTATNAIPECPAPGPGHEVEIIQAQDVLRALRSLPVQERTVAAFDMDDIPTADIARELHISEQRVRDMRKKYRAKLKRNPDGTQTEGRN
jgi:RNA polymerase sigma factor (sigma-70 family)